MKWRGIIEEFRSRLKLPVEAPELTLLEGNTPLIPVPNFVKAIGGDFSLHIKFEAGNPTGSFKDRGMVVAVACAKARGAQAVICASTGNTSASAAAYAARAGLKCVVILPAGKIAMGKLAQAIIYGSSIVPIRGNFDEALDLIRELGKRPEFEVVNSINPVRIEGQKTASFEICDVLGRAPDYHFLPVGNAGNITAYWRGYVENFEAGITKTKPRMCGWQAAGSAPIVENRIIEKPHTIATAIRIGNPASWEPAKVAIRESNGSINKVTDEQILAAYSLIAKTEGIFVEPASAAPLAGLIETVKLGGIPSGSVVTATLTGHGLKDPDTALHSISQPLEEVDAKLDDVLKAINL